MTAPKSEVENAILRNLLAHTTRAYEEQVAALSREKELAQVTLASIADGVMTTDRAGRVRYLNPVAEKLTGWGSEEASGEALERVLRLIDEVSGDEAPLAVIGEPGAELQGDLERRRLLERPDGQRFAVELSAAPIRDGEGRAIGLVIVFQDVTDHRLLSLQLAHQASHDALTGLLNRQAFEGQLQAALEEAAERGAEHCLCYMDLDQFKLVNDTCGHLAGDELLRRLGTVILEQMRDGDPVARLGGDEFGVLLRGASLEEGLELAREIHRTLELYRFVWQDKTFTVSTSIGLVPIGATTRSLGQILSAADHACYMAKDKGRNRLQVYRSGDAELLRRTDEMNWVVRIHKTMEEGRFRLYGQPIRRLVREAPEPLFFEVLLRMIDEDGQVLTPTPFVRAAERYGVMGELDRWVLDQVLEYLEGQPRWFLADLGTCSINLSAVSISDESFLELVRQRLAAHDVPPEKLCFEITETAVMANLPQAQRLIRELSALGCRFALDDFGCGMASYSKLKTLQVSYLKIDGTFVRDLASNPLDRAMVESINQMAHVLGIETVAEGVAAPRLLARLATLGVDYAQGFEVGEPAPLATVGRRAEAG